MGGRGASSAGVIRAGGNYSWIDGSDKVARQTGLTPDEVAKLGGVEALPGAKVYVGKSFGQYQISVYHPHLETPLVRTMYKDSKGRWTLENEQFFKKASAPAGLGAKVVYAQAKALRSVGGVTMRTNAVRWKNANGYYTWARIGYNARVTGPGGSSTDLHALMKTAEGRAWWKANGKTTDMTFDVRANSPHMKALKEYMRK